MNIFFPRFLLVALILASSCTSTRSNDYGPLDLAEQCADSNILSCIVLTQRERNAAGKIELSGLLQMALEKACEHNHITSCYLLGMNLQESHISAVSQTRASQLLKKACNHRNGDACALLAKNQSLSMVDKQSLLLKACDLGFIPGCQSFAKQCEKEPSPVCSSSATWRALFLECQQRKHRSCSNSDFISPSSRHSMQAACAKGYATACFFAGKMADDGIAGKKDRIWAKSLYKTACRKGHSDSCNNLGEMLAKGIGGKKDPKHAQLFFHRACQLDGGLGCFNQGIFYQWDNKLMRAKKSHERACWNDNAQSCAQLAWFWSWGWANSPRNSNQSRLYLERACQLKDEISCQRLSKYSHKKLR